MVLTKGVLEVMVSKVFHIFVKFIKVDLPKHTKWYIHKKYFNSNTIP